MFEDHHQREVTAHRQVCLRLRHQKGPKQGHCRPQSQHHVSAFKKNVLLFDLFILLYLHLNLDSLSSFAHFRKLGDGLFLQSCAEVAQLYPKIKYENIIIDNCCMQVCTHSTVQSLGSNIYILFFILFQ